MKALARALKSGSKNKRVLPARERVLVEFPAGLLERADEAARALKSNRSQLIRSAVEQLLDGMEAKRFEARLAVAYAANAEVSRKLAEEFEAVDREGF